MAVDETLRMRGAAPLRPVAASARRLGPRSFAYAALVAAAIWFLSFGETRLYAHRLVNPTPPNPLPQLRWAGHSVDQFWVPIFYGITVAAAGLMIWRFVQHRRQTGSQHPAVPLFIALGVVGFLSDPIYNWAMYCNYDPKLLHWPVTWGLFSVAPTVEPLWIVMGAYQVFFLGPAMGFFALHRKYVLNRAKDGSWTGRHPVASVLIFSTVLGCFADILMEQWMLNMGIYKYTQIAGPSMVWGTGRLQVFEIAWIGLLIGMYSALLHRDDQGRSVVARVGSSVTVLHRLRVRNLGVAILLTAVALYAYGAFFATLRLTHQAKVIPGTYPYRAVKTYDPDGLMTKAGQPGPYFAGIWCTGRAC